MAWTPYQTFLALLMVITGSINTLSTKFGDDTESVGRDGTLRKFSHPFIQACAMFVGETTCLFAFFILYQYYTRRLDYSEQQLPPSIAGERFNRFIFLLPSLCDMTATSTMYLGLIMTSPSSFQMLRGSLIVFTGLLSMVILKRRLRVFEWLGIFLILAGLITVGLNDMLFPDSKQESSGSNPILGDILIIVAQVATAVQMVVEEKFVRGRNISPLQAVGLEGFFGFAVLSLLLVPMYYIKVAPPFSSLPDYRLEDPIDAFYQLKNNWITALCLGGNVVSIAFFNFAGISVTKELSATTRTVLDSIRTLVVWLVWLALGRQDFHVLQLCGFVLLILGMFIYNDVLIRPYLIRKGILVPIAQSEDEATRVVNNGSERGVTNRSYTDD